MNGNSPQPGSGFDYDLPQTDSDPYGFSESPNPPNSPFAEFPVKVTIPPFTIGKRLTYFTQSAYETRAAAVIYNKLKFIRIIAERWPTEEETNYSISSVDMFTNVTLGSQLAGASLAGLYLARRYRSLGPGGLNRATIIRTGLVFPTLIFFGRGIGAIIGNAMDSIATANDPRLARFNTELQRMGVEGIRRRLAQHRNQEMNKVREVRSQPSPYQNAPGYDASPTSGAFSSDYNEDYGADQQSGSSSGTPWGDIYRQGVQHQGAGNQSTPSPSSRGQQQRSQQGETASSGVGFFDEDDRSDASTSSPSSPPASGDSSWARIRASAGANSSQPQQPQTESSSQQWQSTEADPSYSGSTSYSSSGPAEETKRAKEQAQAEFDRLLQRERDFGTGTNESGERKGSWGRNW